MQDIASLTADELPKVVVFATGGTIAGSSADPTNTTRYDVGELRIETLVQSVPALSGIARLEVRQFASVASSDFDSCQILQLARAVNACLADATVTGVVVTHGTDTLEETAFVLDLATAGQHKPVVLVGAMRPATALSADGPLNLAQAVSLAASVQACGRGVLAVMNDRIESGFYTTKRNATVVDAFCAPEQGSLGLFLGTTPRFYYEPATPTGRVAFDVSLLESLPKVAILYLHGDQDSEQIDMVIERGVEGIVLAANGAGSITTRMKPKIEELTRLGFPVVRSSRTGSGFAVKEDGGGIAAGLLNPQKARLLLMLALSQGADLDTIRGYFLRQS